MPPRTPRETAIEEPGEATVEGLNPSTVYVIAAAGANGTILSAVDTIEMTTLTPTPEIALAAGETGENSLTFSVTLDHAERAAYVCLEKTDELALPTAEEILAEGTAIEESGETGGDGPDTAGTCVTATPTGETTPMRPAVAENGSGSGNTAPKRPFIVRMRWTTGESNGLRAPLPDEQRTVLRSVSPCRKMRRHDECSQGRRPSEVPSGPTARSRTASEKRRHGIPASDGTDRGQPMDPPMQTDGSQVRAPMSEKCGGTTSVHKGQP